MFAAISELESARQTELTDLMMTLPRRDRAMCFFNVEVLRRKLSDAKLLLDDDGGDLDVNVDGDQYDLNHQILYDYVRIPLGDIEKLELQISSGQSSEDLTLEI